jgi:hypothetical protein
MVLADQDPESARRVSSPDAPARRPRSASSSTNLVVPRAVLARPVRWRAREHLAAVGTGGEQRMLAEGVGVAVGGALLVVAVHLADGGVQVMVIGPSPGRPSRPRAREQRLGEPVELADMPEGEGAQEGPQGGGGHDRWPSTWLVASPPSRSASSMPSPPAGIDWTRVSSLPPGRYAPARSPRSSRRRWPAAGPGGRQQQARVGHRMGVGNAAVELVQVWQDPIEHAPP